MFQELISDHKTLVLIHWEGRIHPFALDQSNPSAIWSREESASWAHFFRFLQLGIEHIFTGYDHILFLIGILLLGSTLERCRHIVEAFPDTEAANFARNLLIRLGI
ncbi:HupE/UreJ family protein [Acidobacteria bacterium AH-259-D05]|nr:HupE/UreJ family protein [Acidobacteria bacterium AH-259-D05]